MAFTRLEPTGVNTSATFTFANANVTTNLNVGGVSNLGPVGNIIITGGTSGQVLSTNGSGGLSWTDQTGGGGGTNYSNSNVAAYLPTFTGNFTAGNISSTGNITAAYFIGNGSQLTGLPASYSNTNVAAYLPTYTGNISANYFIGNGSALSSITGANVSGQVSNALVASTVYSNAQPNITSVGTLTSVNVSGNVSSGGNIIGNGQYLTSITGGNVTGQVANALVAGTVYTAAQPSITSVGTLTSLSVTGNISTAGNVIGNGQFLTSITGGNITGQVANALVAGTVYTAAQPSITSVGTLTSLSVTGLTTATGGVRTGNIQDTTGTNTISVSSTTVGVIGNLTVGTGGTGNVTATYFIGNGSTLTSITGGNVTGQVANALVAGTVYTAAQPSITSVGTLTSLSVTGNVSSGGNIIGNGQFLTSITGGNVTGQVANALVAGTVYTNAQPNITSVGTLSALSVSGNISTGNLLTDNLLYANGVAWSFGGSSYSNANVAAYLPTYTGNVSANYFIGNALTVGTGVGGTISGADTITSNNVTISNTLNVTGKSMFGLSSDETTYVSASTSGTYTADTTIGPIWYFTTIAGATTLNFTNLPTTDGYTTVLVAMFASTTTVPAVQIAGVAQTIKWVGGAAPTGNASGINIYTFSCVRVNSAWTAVLGSYSYYA